MLGARSLAFSSFLGWRRPRPDDVALSEGPANRRGKQPLCGSTTGVVERPLAILQRAGAAGIAISQFRKRRFPPTFRAVIKWRMNEPLD